MTLRATILIFAVGLLFASSRARSAFAQDQAPQPGATSNPEQPSASPPAGPRVDTQAPPSSQPESTPAKPAPPVLRRKKHKPAANKSRSVKKQSSRPGKVVVRNGGAKEGSAQLAPGMSQEQVQHQKANTDELLAMTDANLKQTAGRQLSPDEQSMVDEIRTYMRQAKAAAADGDVTRAHTLAYKAHLLSDELARK